MNIIDKNTSLLSKKDILDINTTYYGVNPIYNCYVEMLHGIFKRFDQSPFRNEIGEESSEVAFYIIMKIIDKVLALSKSVAKDEDILIEHYLEQIPVYLFKNYKQIFDFSYVANIKAQCRVIAVCQTLFFCLEYVRKTRGRTALILDAFYSNVDMLDKYCITRGNSLVRESSAVRSQGIEPLMQKKSKNIWRTTKNLMLIAEYLM